MIFFQNQPFSKILSEISNRLDLDQSGHFVGPDLVPNCLQNFLTISADNTWK